jgi:hypothetical protein
MTAIGFLGVTRAERKDRLGRLARCGRIARRSPVTGATILLAILPLLAAFPSTIGWLHVNPLYTSTSGLLLRGDAGVLGGVRTFDDDNGTTVQALGHLSADQWLAGKVPWWNPYSGVGMPLAAEGQPAAFFLPFVLLLHFSNGVLILKYLMQVLAGLVTFALLRRLRMATGPALTGAALYELNGTFAWFGHGPILPIPFLPLLLLGIEHARHAASDRQPLGWIAIALAVAFSLTAGFPETAYIDGIMGLVWAMFRLAGQRRHRSAMIGKLCLGAATGVLIAAPSVWPLVHFLAVGTAVNHDAFIGDALHATPLARLVALLFPELALHLRQFPSWGPGIPAIAFPVLVFPYLFGSPLEATGTPIFATQGEFLGFLGGYLPLSICFLALCALGGSRERGLRWLLAGWIFACLAKTAGVPLVVLLFDCVPFVGKLLFFRYAEPSWILAAVILCSFCIDDWRTGPPLAWPRLRLALIVSAGIAAAALAIAARVIVPLLAELPTERFYLAGSLLLSTGVIVASVAMLRRAARAWPAALISVLLVTESGALFMAPVLTGLRHPVLDTGLIDFLYRNLGLARFYALGPYRPNYSAFFTTPSINHEYLPLPRNWVDYVHDNLDPTSAPVQFRGDEPPPAAQHMNEFVARVTLYEEVGVRYLVTPAGLAPDDVTTRDRGPGETPRALAAGESLSGSFTIPTDGGGEVRAVSIRIGTYGGASNGDLAVSLCARHGCAGGSARLDGATDNAQFSVPLQAPLTLAPGEALHWKVEHLTGDRAVAIWLAPGRQQHELIPRLVLSPRDVATRDVETPAVGPDATAHVLHAGERLSGWFPIPADGGGEVRAVSVLIGTYLGAADGTLWIDLCGRRGCTSGSARLEGATDDAQISVPLQAPLTVEPEETLRWTVEHLTGDSAVAVWLAPGRQQHEVISQPDEPIPRLVLQRTNGMRRVYSDPLADIYELPSPRPYAETIGGPCRLEVINREEFLADCVEPAVLLRRELFFPGWRASVDGVDQPIAEHDGIFQQVMLSAGRSRIRFAYVPPFIGAAWIAFGAGISVLAAGMALSRRASRHPGLIDPASSTRSSGSTEP